MDESLSGSGSSGGSGGSGSGSTATAPSAVAAGKAPAPPPVPQQPAGPTDTAPSSSLASGDAAVNGAANATAGDTAERPESTMTNTDHIPMPISTPRTTSSGSRRGSHVGQPVATSAPPAPPPAPTHAPAAGSSSAGPGPATSRSHRSHRHHPYERERNRNDREGGGARPSTSAGGMSSTLDDVMRAPSRDAHDIVVADAATTEAALLELEMETPREAPLNPKEDLWLSTADSRYNSPIIPLRVGQFPENFQTFYVHKSILMKSEWFKTVLSTNFKEKEEQAVDLPEEDPGIFHFIIAFLYEERYAPIRPVASVLVPDLDKGKGKEAMDENSDSESDSSFGTASDSSARSRRRRVRRRRRDERRLERLRQKHPGVHRPGCPCPSCVTVNVGPPCWSCFAPRVPPPGPMPPPPPPGVVVVERDRSRRRGGRHNHHNRHRRVPLPRTVSPPPPPGAEREPGSGNERIKGEDMRTWTLTLELNMDVYICANKFLMADFKDAIARCCIDMLETAGTDAAQPEVLRMCKKLHAGVPESDPLLKMLLARVGFLQPLLWKRAPDETSEFLHENPQVTALMLREMATRRDDDLGGTGRYLPSLERGWVPPSTPGGGHPGAPVHVFDPYGFHPHRPLPPHARPPRAVW